MCSGGLNLNNVVIETLFCDYSPTERAHIHPHTHTLTHTPSHTHTLTHTPSHTHPHTHTTVAWGVLAGGTQHTVIPNSCHEWLKYSHCGEVCDGCVCVHV